MKPNYLTILTILIFLQLSVIMLGICTNDPVILIDLIIFALLDIGIYYNWRKL
jgi:hypothetical protein